MTLEHRISAWLALDRVNSSQAGPLLCEVTARLAAVEALCDHADAVQLQAPKFVTVDAIRAALRGQPV